MANLARRRMMVIAGLAVLLVLAIACAKGEGKTATTAPASSAEKATSQPAAAPAPKAAEPAPQTAAPAPLLAVAALAEVVRPNPGPGVAAPGLPGYLDRPIPQGNIAKERAVEILLEYSAHKLPLWTKAKYGGEVHDVRSLPIGVGLNPFKTGNIHRSTYFGNFIRVDMGRCSLQGKADMSVCDGKRAEVYAGVLVPDVVERWEQPSPLTYLLHVSPRAKWPAIPPMNRADRQVTAEDIKWYMETQRREGFFVGRFERTETIQALDRLTVKVTMKAPHADFIRGLAQLGMGVIPRECYEDKGCIDNKVISPAPFIITTFEPRVRAILARNLEYQIKGVPWVDRIVATVITDVAAQKAAFITGKVQSLLLVNSGKGELESILKQRPSAQVQAAIAPTGYDHLVPSLNQGPMADVRVRQALTQAVDWLAAWQGCCDGYKLMQMEVPWEYLGLTMPLPLADSGPNYQYNPQNARKLLADAGYPNGFKVTVQTASASGTGYDLQLIVQDYWKRNLSVETEFKVIDGAAFTNSLYSNSWKDLAHTLTIIIGGGGGADADSSLLPFVSGNPQNLQKINDPVVDELYRKQVEQLDPAKRRALLWEFQQHISSKLYNLGQGSLPHYTVFQPWEMNAADHTYVFFSPVLGSGWTTMIDPDKLGR